MKRILIKPNKLLPVVWLVLAAVMISCSGEPVPPVAKRIAKADTLFGDVRVDYYYWLRDRNNPEVIAYLEAENRYTDEMMKDTRQLQEKLFEELKSTIQENDESVPVWHGGYYYYRRLEAGKQYPIYCRKKGSLDAEEEVYLDVNQLAEGKKYYLVQSLSISPDHSKLAFLADTTGREQFVLMVKDLTKGSFYPETIANVSSDIAWASDNRTIFYTTLDSTLRPYRLYRHELGENPAKDQLVYQENDGKFYLNVERSRSGSYLFMSLNSQVTSEVWYLPAGQPNGQWRVIKPREYQVEYKVEHQGNYFYIVTNKKAVNFKVMRTLVTRPDEKYWDEFIPHDPAVMINDIDAFQDFLALSLRKNGIRLVQLVDIKGNRIDLPAEEEIYTMWLGENPEYKADRIRYHYTSLITPETVFDYIIATGRTEMKKQDIVPGYDRTRYETIQLWATAKDGTKIPLSLVYRKGIKKDGHNPCYLYGYGSYGASMDPRFSPNRLALLNRGFVYAIAHIRGGGEMGRQWYLDGKWLKKKNTFEDFIAAAEYLIQEKYTNPEKLVISGGSAGGLLMGAVTNMRPDLFKAVIAKVPFVDVVNTMLDPSIPLTVIEYDEWGNPRIEEYYHYMKSYSPYDNVEEKAYPNILVTAGLYDPRVQYWEPAKWVAKLRSMKTDHNLLLLHTNMSAGHFSYSGRYDYLKDVAFEYAFIFKVLGMNEE